MTKRYKTIMGLYDESDLGKTDARLLAAAPDLLEAARQVIWKMGHNERNDEPGGYCGPIRITRSDATVRMLCHAIAAIDGDTDHTCPGERAS